MGFKKGDKNFNSPEERARRAAGLEAMLFIEKRDANASYLNYVEIVNTTANDETDWKRGRHLIYLCNKVQEFIEADTGNPYDIMVINLPPQTGKSTSVTEALPSWFLGKYPDESVIALAYGDDLAQRFGRRNKSKIENYGKRLFDIELSRTKNANDDFEIEGHRGRMITRGIMSGITGNAGKLILIDDPVKTKEEAYSENYRQKLWDEWQFSIRTRLAAGAKIILIMTRWHEDDLAGRILETEKNVQHINIPCEAEEGDILGRAVGEGPFPEIGKDRKWKDAFKQSYIDSEGMDTWNAMYQGRPSAQKGNIFFRDWWKFYTELPQLYQVILSVDAAFKDKATSDKVAMGVWGKNGTNVYLVDIYNQVTSFTDTIKQIKSFKNKYPAISMILIEDKANGSAIIDTLKREIMGVVPVEPLGSKESRARAISPFVEAGNVYLPKGIAWTEDYIDQMAKFPKGKFDDLVDMTSQALVRFKNWIANGPEKPKERDDYAMPEISNKFKLKNIKIPKAFFKY